MVVFNDELSADLHCCAFAGPVHLGGPHDVLASRFTPTLENFAEAFPEVESSLRSTASADLPRDLATGRLDLVVVEEALESETGEFLGADKLSWVGAQSRVAFTRRPADLHR